MASTVTLLELRTRIRERCAYENAQVVTDAELNRLINVHRKRLHMRIARKQPRQYATDQTISVTSGTIAYSLPAAYLWTIAVWVAESSDQYRPLRSVGDLERVTFRAPTGSATVIHRYVAVPTALSGDSDTVDGIIGFDEWIVCSCVRSIKTKVDTDAMPITAELADLERDILSCLDMRDQGYPKLLEDVYATDAYPYPYSASLTGYQVRGDYLDIFSFVPFGP